MDRQQDSLLRTQAVGAVVIEVSILSNFQGYFIGIFGGGILGGGDKFKQSQHNQMHRH